MSRFILDGAMHTMAERVCKDCGVTFPGCADALCLSHPDIVKCIHSRYLAAGAGAVTTCTFGASGPSVRVEKAVKIACEAAIPYDAKVMGCMSPMATDNPVGLIGQLVDSGVDVLWLQSVYSLNGGERLLEAVNELRPGVPVWLTATVGEDGKLPDGSSLSAFADMALRYKVGAVGLNCSVGAVKTLEWIKSLRGLCEGMDTVFAPSAGVPDECGNYYEKPLEWAECVLSSGAENIGGCCGTSPDYIRLLCTT